MPITHLCATVVLCMLGFIGCARGWTWLEQGDDKTQEVTCLDENESGNGGGMLDDCAVPADEDPVEILDMDTTTTSIDVDTGCGS